MFILVVDSLDAIFKLAMAEGFLDGISNARRSWVLANLHFADDTLIFSSLGADQAVILKILLYYFEMASRLKFFSKSSLIYLGQEQGKEAELSAILTCKIESLPIKYLGLPLGQRGPSTGDWLKLKKKVNKNLASWKGKLLSLGGRLTLVNVVLSAIPSYYMSIFPLPAWVIKNIDGICKHFL